MLILVLTWHLMAQARLDENIGDIVSASPIDVTEPAELGLLYTSRVTMNPSRDWPGGSRVKWYGNDLLHLKCEEGRDAPPIMVRVQDFSDKKAEKFECQDGTLMAEPLYRFNNMFLKSCLHTGMRAGSIRGQIKNIVINTKGVHRVRKSRGSSKFSQHSTGRAMDVVTFDVTMEDGTKKTLPASCVVNPPGNQLRSPGFSDINSCAREGSYGKFYDAFTKCWEDNVAAEKARCHGLNDSYCKDLQNDAKCTDTNALGCDDKGGDHKDHMHISLPICPKDDRISQT